MIRPKWPSCQATTSSIRQCAYHHRRFISSSSAPPHETPDGLQRRDEEQQENQTVQWPGLRRRTPSSIEQATAQGANVLSLRPAQSIAAITSTPSQLAISRPLDSNKNMLIFTGLSKNLVASDFYRLSPESQSLSTWGSTIKKVQQRRDKLTLEPTGIYHVSFSTSEAAAAYHDRIARLHQLAKVKSANRNGLWTATIPKQLDVPGADPEQELESYSLLPPSQDLLVTRARTAQNNWEKHLREIVTKDYGPKPAAVLLHADPPDLAVGDLHDAILKDGEKRDSRWKTQFPVSLMDASTPQASSQTTSKLESHILESLRGRFVLAFSNEWEARRFQRGWNQRQLEVTSTDDFSKQHLLNVSFINW
ncbi:unnamed protein product [Clonostachys rosea]|uniref:Uncharacterized protein n=1 Tax=Bionectria ochroleuca TaxID=29856 RepID=A0ABY6V548_BIOOC|nr:unnamed protein product [Clonostachys rosea]